MILMTTCLVSFSRKNIKVLILFHANLRHPTIQLDRVNQSDSATTHLSRHPVYV